MNAELKQESQQWREEEMIAARDFYALEPNNDQASECVEILNQELHRRMTV